MTTKITGDNISSIANTGVNWNAVTVADGSTQLTAEAGKGYFLDTNTGVIEVFLPTSPTRGDTIILVDYAGTFATNNVIINTGTNNLDSTTTRQYSLTQNDTIAEFVYIDSAKGWITRINTTAGTTPSGAFNQFGGYDTESEFIVATGGTVTTTGDYKIHTFTGDGCFVVCSAGGGNNCGPSIVDYLVVAGGGGAGNWAGGGGGAGGFREGKQACSPVHTPSPHTASPAAATTGITVSAQTYPITVGAGGAGFSCSPSSPLGGSRGSITAGSNSIFSTITSAGGGAGGIDCGPNAYKTGDSGGSGGGGNRNASPRVGGAGNTPPVSPPQGFPGGNGYSGPVGFFGGGGGGASQAGEHACANPNDGGFGGAGLATLINPATGEPSSCTQYYAGGGGGGNANNTGAAVGGLGGGGNAAPGTLSSAAENGTANTGGGGGGSGAPSGSYSSASNSGSGGKGIVIIRYKYQ